MTESTTDLPLHKFIGRRTEEVDDEFADAYEELSICLSQNAFYRLSSFSGNSMVSLIVFSKGGRGALGVSKKGRFQPGGFMPLF